MKNLATKKDSILVKEYIEGNEIALEYLIKRHQQKLFGFIYSKVQNKNITEDVFQDTFIKVIKTLKKGTYNEEGKFLPWVTRIAHNLVIDYFRAKNRIPVHNNYGEFDVFSIIADDTLNIEDTMVKEQILSDVRFLVEELPLDQKEVLKMRIFNQMSFNQIAENTGVSINTALGRMRYAVINLRKIINKHSIALAS